MLLEHIKGTSSFMDDIVVLGTTIEEHDQRFKYVLETVRRADLKLNKSKCVFGVQELKFLGNVISDKGIKPDPAKFQAIEQLIPCSDKSARISEVSGNGQLPRKICSRLFHKITLSETSS